MYKIKASAKIDQFHKKIQIFSCTIMIVKNLKLTFTGICITKTQVSRKPQI